MMIGVQCPKVMFIAFIKPKHFHGFGFSRLFYAHQVHTYGISNREGSESLWTNRRLCRKVLVFSC